jgi:hypothetical protein
MSVLGWLAKKAWENIYDPPPPPPPIIGKAFQLYQDVDDASELILAVVPDPNPPTEEQEES